MNRPPLEAADIIRSAGESFRERSRRWITRQHCKVLDAILRCRTAVLGGHRGAAQIAAQVTFRWRDSAHGNKKRLMRLPIDEFLRRFLLHVLPRGFVRIRNFGFLANRRRAALLPLCFQLLRRSTENTPSTAPPSATQPCSCWRCPVCGGTMHIIERISAPELRLRAPPQTVRCAA